MKPRQPRTSAPPGPVTIKRNGTIVEVRAPLTRSGKRAPLRQLRIEMRGYVRALRAGAEWDGRNLRGRRRAMRSLVEPGYAQAREQALDHLQHDERYRDTLEANEARRSVLDTSLLARGIFVKPGKPLYLSTAHDDATIRETRVGKLRTELRLVEQGAVARQLLQRRSAPLLLLAGGERRLHRTLQPGSAQLAQPIGLAVALADAPDRRRVER